MADRPSYQPPDSYDYLVESENQDLAADQPAQGQSGFTKEGLRKELLLELREKKEQKWREQWTDKDKNSLRRKYQERRMEETYEMRNRWRAKTEPYNQNDYDTTDPENEAGRFEY